MKILDGQLVETQFEWPTVEGERLKVKQETALEKNSAAYIHGELDTLCPLLFPDFSPLTVVFSPPSDKIGLHRIENKSHVKGAVSLHLYTPPYSECRSFNEEEGTARKSGNITFYSVNGKKVERF